MSLPMSGFAGSVSLLTSWGACRLHDLARIHFGKHPPLVLYDLAPEDRVPLERVHVIGEASEWVDVVIGRYVFKPADGDDNSNAKSVDIRVRCTPDVLFVTARGDVRAADLVGETVVRVALNGTGDVFTVPEVLPVVLAAPVPVYRVECSADACCVGADSTVAAVVRC